MKQLLFFSTLLLFAVFCSCKEQEKINTETAPVTTTKAETPAKKVATMVETPKRKKATLVTKESAEQSKQFPFDINLKDVDGKIIKSSEVFKQNGKPTVLMFWLTTCAPCHRKLQAIKPLYPQWAKEADFNMYAISGDYEKNFPTFVKQTKQKDWEWETYNDCDRSFRNILPGKLNGYPQTFIFDKTGKLVYQDKRYKAGDEVKLFETIKGICAQG